MELQNWIIEWFIKKGTIQDKEAAETDKNFVNLGYVDSLGFMVLIEAIEEEFQVTLGEDDLQKDSILSISGLAEIISDKI